MSSADHSSTLIRYSTLNLREKRKLTDDEVDAVVGEADDEPPAAKYGRHSYTGHAHSHYDHQGLRDEQSHLEYITCQHVSSHANMLVHMPSGDQTREQVK